MKKTLATLLAAGLTCGFATGQADGTGKGKDDQWRNDQVVLANPDTPVVMKVPCPSCYEELATTNLSRLSIDPIEGLRGLFIGQTSTFRLQVENRGILPVGGTYMIAIGTDRFMGPGLGWVDPTSGFVSQQILRFGSARFFMVGTHAGSGDVVLRDFTIPRNTALLGQSWYAQAGLHHYLLGGFDISPNDYNLLSTAVGGEISRLY